MVHMQGIVQVCMEAVVKLHSIDRHGMQNMSCMHAVPALASHTQHKLFQQWAAPLRSQQCSPLMQVTIP